MSWNWLEWVANWANHYPDSANDVLQSGVWLHANLRSLSRCTSNVPPMSHVCPTYVPQVWDWEILSGMQSTRKDFGESHWFQPVHSNWNCDSSAMSSVAVISHFSSQSQFRILYHTLSLINLHTAKTCCDVGKPARVTLRCLHTSVSIFQLRPDSP